MADEKLNTGPAENISPEAAEPIATPEQAAASEPQQEQTGPAICTPTSSPKPGDLVFFKGTYDTPGVSHCGIYVGDGKMLHCGDPIGYANLNTSYWQSHFYAYGRLP